MKKLISLILALALVVGLIPAFALGVSADDAAPAAGTWEAVLAAKAALDEALAKKDRGFLGFIEWMSEKPNLTQRETADLNAAKKVLTEAMEEDFSHWYHGDNTGMPEFRNDKVVVLGDPNDAVALDNIQPAIEVMKKINLLRASDNNYVGAMQRNPGKTNFYVMAIALSGADRGAGLGRHSLLQISCENLAFGYADPTEGWYTKEKTYFDQIREALGITALTEETLQQIKDAASAQHIVIGHYTNLMWSADQVMGVGRTQYRTTSCYNASKASNYESKYALYTVEQLEELLASYVAALNLEALQADYEAALAAYEAAQSQPEHNCPCAMFKDMPEYGTDEHAAIDWAYTHDPQITNGTSKTKFSPNKTVTRAQAATFLWRAAGCPTPKTTENPFTDVVEGEYYYEAVLWAVEEGITTGTSKTKFSPAKTCSIEQIITFLYRFEGKPDVTDLENPYTDAADGFYSTNPLIWAYHNGIYTGKEGTTEAGRLDGCTRTQVVTFLWRDIAPKEAGE